MSSSRSSQPPAFRALVVANTAKDHAKMIAAARPFFETLAAENGFAVKFTDDPAAITDENLAHYQVFVQLQRAPFEMNAAQQAALQGFIESGKGWIGIHAAGLTGKMFQSPERTYWQWYEDFLGGVQYSPHPAYQEGVLVVEDRTHPATRNLPATFVLSDEWYEFHESPRGRVRVLASADEGTYKQNKPMGDHPLIWTNEAFPRSLYIGIGHDPYLFDLPDFRMLLRDAVLWAAGAVTP